MSQPLPPDTAASEDQTVDKAAWGAPARTFSRLPAYLAVLAALLLYVTLPDRLIFTSSAGPVSSLYLDMAGTSIYLPRFIVPILELALFLPLALTAPQGGYTQIRWPRVISLALIALINLANVISLILLLHFLLRGGKTNGVELIISSFQIWLTNVIVFGLWFWELDRGGPHARCRLHHRNPDFLFPQMSVPRAAPPDWSPSFVDYLYVSFTNATAFSPTDTMPLTEWAKMLMLVQSLASLVTVALVAARAVNILS